MLLNEPFPTPSRIGLVGNFIMPFKIYLTKVSLFTQDCLCYFRKTSMREYTCSLDPNPDLLLS